MNSLDRKNILHDINAIFDSVVYELCNTSDIPNWIQIHLAEGIYVTAGDFIHLLTIAQGYNVRINIFVVNLNQLGIFFVDVE